MIPKKVLDALVWPANCAVQERGLQCWQRFRVNFEEVGLTKDDFQVPRYWYPERRWEEFFTRLEDAWASLTRDAVAENLNCFIAEVKAFRDAVADLRWMYRDVP